MKIKLRELRQLVRQCIDEGYEVDSNDEVSLTNPLVLWNNTFDMDDQETMTKIANARINLNLPAGLDSQYDGLDDKMRSVLGPNSQAWMEGKERKRTDSYGCESPFALDKYNRKKSRYQDRDKVAAEGFSGEGAWGEPATYKKKGLKTRKQKNPYLEDKYPKKDGWQGERYRNNPIKTTHKPTTTQKKLDDEEKGMRGPGGVRLKIEDKYPKKAGWQGERDDDDGQAEKKRKMKAQKRGAETGMRGPGGKKVAEASSPAQAKRKMKAQIKGKEKGMRGPGGKKVEAKYPDKDGWQGETYKDSTRKTLKKKTDKKRSLPKQPELEEVAPPGFKGTVKAMQRGKKKGKNKIDNPWALSWHMKNKGDKSHYTAKGKKKKS